jgi:hypothetical protein
MRQCPPRRAALHRKRSSNSTQVPLFPLAANELRIELAAPQDQELIRAVAELLLQVAINGTVTDRGGRRDDQ